MLTGTNPRTGGPGSGDVPRWRAQHWFPHGFGYVCDFDLNRTGDDEQSMSLFNFLVVLGLPRHHGGHRLHH